MLRKIGVGLGLALALAALDRLLRSYLADGQTIAALLSPGTHSSAAALGVALVFLAIRLTLLVLLPAALGASVVVWLVRGRL